MSNTKYDLSLFPSNLRKYRSMAKLTQVKLTNELQINTQNYSRIENGKKIPSLELVTMIAEAINTPLSCLLSEDDTIDEYIFDNLSSLTNDELQRVALHLEAMTLDK